MRIGKIEIPWSDVGKIAAGIATIILSFVIFLNASKLLRLGVLAMLVVLFFLYRHVSAGRRMPSTLENKLKGEDDRKKYG